MFNVKTFTIKPIGKEIPGMGRIFPWLVDECRTKYSIKIFTKDGTQYVSINGHDVRITDGDEVLFQIDSTVETC